MKKITCLIFCIGLAFISFAQDSAATSIVKPLTKQGYLRKSRGQLIGGLILLPVGAGLVIAGAIKATDNIHILGDDSDSGGGEAISIAELLGGVACIIVGSNLLVSSHKNKKRAMSLSFKNETAPQLQRSFVHNRYMPALSLKISL